ncbi:MAG TPA: PAS domain-containing protein [Vicinamibacterales bacterium]|nr:PAS domain-containing protein [Vicinamibacterales bacterium]
MALPNSDQILRAVIEATPDAIFVKDLDGRYVLVNAAAARFLGKSPVEIVGKRDLELYPEATARRFIEDDRTVLASGRPQDFEGVAISDDGTPQTYLVTKGVYRDRDGAIVGLFGISHDITELRHAQDTLEQTREALFRSQKMEAVGQLTGGIAHDFNNILAIILGNVELLRAYLPKDKYADEIIDAVLRATMHGRDLTGHLLAFSRRRLLNPQPVDVNGLVAGIVRLLGRTLGASIQLTTDTAADAGVAFVDPGALEAAVLNVALNARDAMPDGGTLTIRTAKTEIVGPSRVDEDLQPGPYVRLSLQDTGSGMASEVAARAFEPFFTTKSGGRGTGLGLSMVYGFAKQSGGTVTIQSQPGRGTTVTMLLPVAASAKTGETGVETPPPSAPHTILVVEDEDDVRAVVRRQLESLGHTVLVAEAATDALLLLHGPTAPDVLVADVVLGTGMNGIDLAAAARRFRPSLPVIFVSGYTAVSEAEQRIREMGALLLSKPFTTPQLDRAVQEVCATAAPRN